MIIIVIITTDTREPRLTVTSFLGPLVLAAWQKDHKFSCEKTLVNTTKMFWPIGDRVYGILV